MFRTIVIGLVVAAFWQLPAAAHPNLGERAFDFDLDRKLKFSAQFDQREPKTGKLDFSLDDDSGIWSVAADPEKYHGPEDVDGEHLFVDRDGDLDDPTLKALRKGWLPLVRSLDPTGDAESGLIFVFEFATAIDVSQLVQGDWLDGDDGAGEPELSFYADIAGTNLITPSVIGQGHNGRGQAVSLVVPSVRRIVLATSRLGGLSDAGGGSAGGNNLAGTDVPEPATALLLLPGLAWLASTRHRARKRARRAQLDRTESDDD